MTCIFSSLTHLGIPAPINAVLAQLSCISQCNTSATNPPPPPPFAVSKDNGLGNARYVYLELVVVFL